MLKTKCMVRADFDEFIECYRLEALSSDGHWQQFIYDEILARDEVSLALFRGREDCLEDSTSLPEPHLLVPGIADDLGAALTQIEDMLGDQEDQAGVPSSPGDRASRGPRP